jgi:tRNA pseudouridine55 synthase
MYGFINLNKSAGISSHKAMAAVRRLLGEKMGHTGTLDPDAAGVLPLCVGKATRLAEYLSICDKVYEGAITLGAATDSYDSSGGIIRETDASQVRQEDVLALLPRFRGEIFQKPPMISALKYRGKPLYKIAREGRSVNIAPRKINIYAIDFICGVFGVSKPVFKVRVSCSKGTYMRSLAHDIGEALDVGAYLSSLKRLAAGNFLIGDAFTFQELAAMWERGEKTFLLSPEKALAPMPVLRVSRIHLTPLLRGNETLLREYDAFALASYLDKSILVNDESGLLLGVGHINIKTGKPTLKLKKVLAEEAGEHGVEQK